MGVTPEEDADFMKEYDEAKITYEQWQKRLQDIYRKRGRGKRGFMINAISSYQYADGARDIIAYLSERRYKIVLITGSIDILARKVAEELDIEMFAAHNTLIFDSDGNFQRIICDGDDTDFKLQKLKEFCSQEGVSITDSVCVGDGNNDIKMFTASGHGVTFEGSIIERYAWKTIKSLSELKNFL